MSLEPAHYDPVLELLFQFFLLSTLLVFLLAGALIALRKVGKLLLLLIS